MANLPADQCPYGQKDCPGGAQCVCALPVDKHDAAGMARWLRERAKANRNTEQNNRDTLGRIVLEPWRENLMPHIAFRLEQAAELIERMDGWLRSLGWEYNVARNSLVKLPDDVEVPREDVECYHCGPREIAEGRCKCARKR